ncbi:MAG: hypothetical protein C7B43_15795 [Sulfobacillus benefaciens]|uniref:Uncharacterized protein n=1 Tax=Sulfobacillus benefaciens TaxID=453960 RepID=A0A2T2WUM8_9FIRM|nr:MAG: hypothetical protein C7B43_15795 [Sulfobacillus benefaciens]
MSSPSFLKTRREENNGGSLSALRIQAKSERYPFPPLSSRHKVAGFANDGSVSPMLPTADELEADQSLRSRK